MEPAELLQAQRLQLIPKPGLNAKIVMLPGNIPVDPDAIRREIKALEYKTRRLKLVLREAEIVLGLRVRVRKGRPKTYKKSTKQQIKEGLKHGTNGRPAFSEG